MPKYIHASCGTRTHGHVFDLSKSICALDSAATGTDMKRIKIFNFHLNSPDIMIYVRVNQGMSLVLSIFVLEA